MDSGGTERETRYTSAREPKLELEARLKKKIPGDRRPSVSVVQCTNPWPLEVVFLLNRNEGYNTQMILAVDILKSVEIQFAIEFVKTRITKAHNKIRAFRLNKSLGTGSTSI